MTRSQRWSLAVLVSALLTSSGCGPVNSLHMAAKESPKINYTHALPPGNGPLAFTPQGPVANDKSPLETTVAELAAAQDTSPAGNRIVVYTATFTMAVPDIDAALATSQKLCENAGGYMESSNSQTLIIRVPSKSFFAILDEIKTLGQIIDKAIQAHDRTDEYVDLRLRLKNAEATLEHLTAILAKATTVKDTLEVEKELARVREEVERLKGQIAKLEKLVSFSTISLTFVRPTAPDVARRLPSTPFPWLDQLGVEHLLDIGR